MPSKIKVVFRRISEPMDPPLFRFTVFSPNGRRILTSGEFNRLVKAQVAWRKIRESVLGGNVAEEYVI